MRDQYQWWLEQPVPTINWIGVDNYEEIRSYMASESEKAMNSIGIPPELLIPPKPKTALQKILEIGSEANKAASMEGLKKKLSEWKFEFEYDSMIGDLLFSEPGREIYCSPYNGRKFNSYEFDEIGQWSEEPRIPFDPILRKTAYFDSIFTSVNTEDKLYQEYQMKYLLSQTVKEGNEIAREYLNKIKTFQ